MASGLTALRRQFTVIHGRRGIGGPTTTSSGGGALGALALVLFKEALAQTDRLRRDLGELVVADELDRVLQGECDRRREQDRFVLARGADVGELLGADRV